MIRFVSKSTRYVSATAVVAVCIVFVFKRDAIEQFVFNERLKIMQQPINGFSSGSRPSLGIPQEYTVSKNLTSESGFQDKHSWNTKGKSDPYRDRLILVNKTCRTSAKLLTHYNFYSSSKHGLSYCLSPKVGCTHWINIFRFLANATMGVLYKSPFDIPRMVTHYGGKGKMEYSEKLDKTVDSNFKFMFVREPYARLWSAYLDKLFLPDFWRSQGGVIQRFFKKRTDSCAKGITFEEFLEYIVSVPPSQLNSHWTPFRYICDPCDFHPDFIGNMETFKQDNKYILENFGLSWIADDIFSRDHATQEIRMLSEYNFDLLKVYKTDCLTATSLSKLLWKTFQANGYIRFNSVFEENKNSYWNCETFISKVLQQRKADKLSSQQGKDQKLAYMTGAYRRVANSVLIKLRELYKEDFEMFGYDPEFIPLN